MSQRSVRLSANEAAKEAELFSYFGVKGDTYNEQYRDFLAKNYNAMRLEHVIETPDNPTVRPAPNINNFRCPLRKIIYEPHRDNKTGAILWYEQKILCVNNPPRATEIADLAICDVCLTKFYGNANRMLAAIHDKDSTPKTEQKEDTPIQELPKSTIPESTRDIFLSHYDHGKHCPFTGKRILKFTCGECSTLKPKRWAACRALVTEILIPQR